MSEGGHVELDHDIRNWEVVPSIVKTTSKLGTSVECVITPYVRINPNVLHINTEQDGIQFDLPTEGALNLVLNAGESDRVFPVGAISIEMIESVPTVSMIKQVKAYKRAEGENSGPNDARFVLGPVFERTSHPAKNLIQGLDKIPWQETLIREGEKVVRKQGFDKIRLVSGFSSKYLMAGHSLGTAVQQYDRFIISDTNWVPFNSNGKPIEDPAQRKLLKATIRRLRDGDIKTKQQVEEILPPEATPAYYQKAL